MKTSLLKVLTTAVFFIVLQSCSNGDDSGTKANSGFGGPSSSLGGSYRVMAMESDISVDLNNDGITNTDLFNEIDPSFFDSATPELEIKPVLYNNKLQEMMNFYLPHSTVTITTPTKPGSVKFSRNGLGYVYQFDKNTQLISIQDSNTSSDPSVYGDMQSVNVIGQNKLQAIFTKYYYDFATAKWTLLTITILYTKI